MYDGEVILKVEDLSKTYYSYPLAVGGLGDVLRNMVRDSTLDSKAEVHALSGVSFDLKRGDSLGVIGPNGAGKSTLLKILSGVSAPSSGSVTINGRVLSVLDIGTGFHPDLSGRENVYLSAEILGMSRKEIDLKYKEIIEFSGIDEFINRPVKHYSSGMYLRLAFSVVVSLDADLLLFDEVLGVGDATFRLRTSARMRELTRSGRSIILVSHNMAEIVETCNRCVRLENGSVRDVGHSIQMVARYGERALTGQELCHNDENAPLEYTEGNGAISIKSPECRWSRLDAPGNGEFLLTRLAVIATGKGIADKVYMKRLDRDSIRA
jgi:lipopolysaccharide transport system ATP-binding protein